mmetsp:Transcript_73730/g.195705  ORF Transcript_73730/g.195705 Transcript_73730/m.195705 type:complete len:241 (+) Transcript_73730:307-1029(+)
MGARRLDLCPRGLHVIPQRLQLSVDLLDIRLVACSGRGRSRDQRRPILTGLWLLLLLLGLLGRVWGIWLARRALQGLGELGWVRSLRLLHCLSQPWLLCSRLHRGGQESAVSRGVRSGGGLAWSRVPAAGWPHCALGRRGDPVDVQRVCTLRTPRRRGPPTANRHFSGRPCWIRPRRVRRHRGQKLERRGGRTGSRVSRGERGYVPPWPDGRSLPLVHAVLDGSAQLLWLGTLRPLLGGL